MLIGAIILSLSCHEFGHAWMAKKHGDNTAEMLGRLTLNPVAHIDPMGLLMVMLIGFGYAKPVPTNPRNFRSKTSDLWIAAAGPLMNLILAIIAANILALGLKFDVAVFTYPQVQYFFFILTTINLMLMIFNLIPLGPLDGHYILPHFLPDGLAHTYRQLNSQYGTWVFLGLVLLSFAGIPIFSYMLDLSRAIIPWITIF